MELTNSCRHFLVNYYLLKQTMDETNLFLEDIAKRLAERLDEHLRIKDDDLVTFDVWVRPGGGDVDLNLWIREGLPSLEHLGGRRYAIVYHDAIVRDDLPDPTSCRVWGYTLQKDSVLRAEIETAATTIGLPDPCRTIDVGLLEAPVDEVVDKLAKIFVSWYDDYVAIIRSLVDRSEG